MWEDLQSCVEMCICTFIHSTPRDFADWKKKNGVPSDAQVSCSLNSLKEGRGSYMLRGLFLP